MGPLRLTAACLNGCGQLDTGTTTDPPAGRYDTRWSQLDATAERHTKQTGHGTTTTARPEVTA